MRPAAALTPLPCRRFFNHTPITRTPPSSSKNHHQSSPRPSLELIALLSGAVSLVVAVSLHHATPTLCDAAPEATPGASSDARDPSLPRFRLSDIRAHDGKSSHPWVIHADKVYDITDWIPAHPGGDVILRAAGGPVEAYWDIFSIHKSDQVLEILQQYLVGFVDIADLDADGLPTRESVEDPFDADPVRDPALLTRTAKPRNAETPPEGLADYFLTPNHLFYVRNHMWVPSVADADVEQYTLTIELPDGDERTYTLAELKSRFPVRRVTAALQCSGNRRSHMSESSGRLASGLPWTVGAISNAVWEGVLLSDVLSDAGFDATSGLSGSGTVKHVHFSGLEAYAASIPLRKAIDPQGDVLLAYGMNGQPLPRDHGFPLRAVVPGHVAARSVKWLSRVTLSDEESWSQWQRRDYKCFGPNQTHVDWETAPAIQEMPVQSAITACRLGSWTRTAASGSGSDFGSDSGYSTSDSDPDSLPVYTRPASLSGYAYSGGGRAIVRVDVSLDAGATWSQATLLPDCTTSPDPSCSPTSPSSPCHGHASWSWRRWKYDGVVPKDAFTATDSSGRRRATFVVKATDEAYNTQPESHAATWNVRGNLATAWHRLNIYSSSPSAPTGEEGPDDPYEGWENI